VRDPQPPRFGSTEEDPAAFEMCRPAPRPSPSATITGHMGSPSVFLTADWRDLAMLNYLVEPSVLAPFVPAGTELDRWNGATFLSIVGFMFLDVRILGIPIPFHRNFEEVNLRFYVRRRGQEGWRRGVVFVKELVPRIAIAWTARALYNENYEAVPMNHRVDRYASNSRNVAGVSASRSLPGPSRNSSPSTTGVTPGNVAAEPWNIGSSTRGGVSGRREKAIWSVKQPVSTATCSDSF
jgi:hypothetical protein